MTQREREAIDLLRRIYEVEAGRPLHDSDMYEDWVQDEIAAYIRRHGAFKDQLS